MTGDVTTAFRQLTELLQEQRALRAERLREATLAGSFEAAQALLAGCATLQRIIDQLQQLQADWEQLPAQPRPPEAGPAKEVGAGPAAGPEERHPELEVAGKLFGQSEPRKKRRRQRVNRTQCSAYRVPILATLEQMGGKGKVREVLQLVEEQMGDRFTEDDVKLLPSGSELRWANTAMWERFHMVRDGLLRKDSPTGIWEMSEQGSEHLRQAREREEAQEA